MVLRKLTLPWGWPLNWPYNIDGYNVKALHDLESELSVIILVW